MPTLFEMLDDALADSQLDSQIVGEAEKLTGALKKVPPLISDPPENMGALVQQLAEMPLPKLEVSGSLAGHLEGIRAALPNDPSAITGSLDTAMSNLESAIDLGLTHVVKQALDVVQALETFLRTDLSCGLTPAAVSASGTVGGADDGPPADAGDGPADPASDAQAVQEGIDRTINALDELPTPLDVPSVLEWLHGTFALPSSAPFSLRGLPVIEPLHDSLGSLLAWSGMSSAQILAHFVSTLKATEVFVRQSREAVLDTTMAELTALTEQFQPDQHAQIARDLTSGLEGLRTAIEDGDLSGTDHTVKEIDAALDQYDELLGRDLEPGRMELLQALTRRIEQLPITLADQMNHIVSVLQPSAALGDWAALRTGSAPTPTAGDAAFTELENFLNTYLAFFNKLVDIIDMSALENSLSTTLDEIHAAADALDRAVVGVTLELQERFAAMQRPLDQLNIDAMIAEAQDAIARFKIDLTQQLVAALAPIHKAIGGVPIQINQAIEPFAPAAIVEPFEKALEALAGVFEDEAVVSSLNSIKTRLEEVAKLLQDHSFTPVGDEVVAAIEGLSEALETIDVAQLPKALHTALNRSLAALPREMSPITEPILEEFGELVENGPWTLVAALQDQAKRVLHKVAAFEPKTLVGDKLLEPYLALLTQMQSFQPSRLLDPVATTLEGIKERLRRNANPAPAVASLLPLAEQLLEDLAALDPGNLIAPFEERVDGLLQDIGKTLPTEEVIEQFGGVVGTLESTLGIGDRVVTLLERMLDLLSGFTGSRQQLNTWLESILAKVDELTDTGPLADTLAGLAETLDSTRAVALKRIFDAAAKPLLDQLGMADLETVLANLVLAEHRIPRQRLQAQPKTPQKEAILKALARFDHIQPVLSAPYRALTDLGTALLDTTARLETVLQNWDVRYHDDEGVVACYRQSEATAAQLRHWLDEALKPQFLEPLTALFEFLELGAPLVAAFLPPLQSTLTEFESKLEGLRRSPESLVEIQGDLAKVVERLGSLSFDMITESVNRLFEEAHGRLEELPDLANALDTASNEMLELLDLNQILYPKSIAEADTTYGDVLDRLGALNPQDLVIDVVQPLYNQVLLLVTTIDLTPLLTTLVEKLAGLDDELRVQTRRIDTAYRQFQRTVPVSATGPSA